MESNRPLARLTRLASSPRVLALMGLLALLPASACAAEGENVILSFDKAGTVTIWVAFVVGLLSVLYGLFVLRPFVMRQSPGDERMQEVGQAIREGAQAYLRRQITTMTPLVVLLMCGLVGLYWRLGPGTAFGVGIAFACGVLASYVSGTTGMLVAVAGNMRTANAALTGFRKSLVVAFRSGAVAGTVTVGIGLMGASLILGLFPGIATNLLVGFAFGASLAALFMRVGGGIFTKAADVGADLVGKVEAGIPEDDPRNPAVIADNVGDNVGDCAGMAADVFESYEVTLIAAIVLGAATASLFDANTWPRLIVYGLAVSAIGLVASSVGIGLVTTPDDPNADALKALKRGFYTAIAITVLGVLGLSAATMKGIRTANLRSITAVQQSDLRKVLAVKDRLAAATNKKATDITPADLLNDPEVQKLGYKESKDKEDEQYLGSLLAQSVRPDDAIPSMSGFHLVDPNATDQPFLDYSVQAPQAAAFAGAPLEYKTVRELLAGADKNEIIVGSVHIKAHIPQRPAQGQAPAQPARDVDTVQPIGPISRASLDAKLDQLRQQAAQNGVKADIAIEKTYPVRLYASNNGQIALGIDTDLPHPYFLRGEVPQVYSKASPAEMQAMATTPGHQAQTEPIEIGLVEHSDVPWWGFALCIGFGILLAFIIEFITDHFVSTDKKPTQEVAGVATAGAAPMVIQGFAHALTSSVYMVLAIGLGLLFPVFVFSPSVYGGYTLSFYGIALVGIGLLTTTAFVLAMDTFGPISDNAQGVFEMSGVGHESPEGAHIVARLDAAGNTTKALTKGFAIATAVVAAVALFHSYVEGAKLTEAGLRLEVPEIFIGLLLGAAAPFLFSAFAIDAVGRASFELIDEVRRQFRNDAGIMAGTSKPDYGRCVAIVTKAAQKELLAPGVLAIALPIAVGFGFSIGKAPTVVGDRAYVLTGAQALGGFLAGAIASGQLMAVLLANAGGMWDNAKKLIEDGLHGGKGTEAHKAAIVGDTIGDPFKDTAGPALNPLIKVMNLVAVLISAVIIQPLPIAVTGSVTAVCVAALVVSIALAKKGSMSSALQAATEGAASSAAHPSVDAPDLTVEPPPKKKLFVEEDEE